VSSLVRGVRGKYELVGSVLGAFEVTPDSRLRSLVREKDVYAEVAAQSKAEVFKEIRRIKGQ
jgi:hypothetical protein